jgi:DNA-binding NtrC family response regulator
MLTSSSRSDVVSGGAIAGRLPLAGRILSCISQAANSTLLEQTRETLAIDSNRSLEQITALLLREPISVILVDEAALRDAVNTDAGTRPLRELANALLGNSGCPQLVLLCSSASEKSLPVSWRDEEVAGRMTLIAQEGLGPETLQAILTLATRNAQTQQKARHFGRSVSPTQALREILGSSSRMQKLYEEIERATGNDTPILLCGERGTGTSLLANWIHDGSSRAAHPFVRVHSRALTSDQLNELLCQDISDAAVQTLPMNTPARPVGGTLFLDEFDSIPVALQKPLCRFVARQQELADGSQGRHQSLVRIIAATHQNFDLPTRQTLGLEILVRGMNAERIDVPALRDRTEDIAPLSEQFFIRWALQEDQPRPRLTRNALECLKEHLWPGNLRELYTVLRNTAILANGTDITADMVRPWLAKGEATDDGNAPRMTLAEMERQLIETTFTRCGGNREKTASSLDIGLRTLSGKLREYGYPPRGGPGSNYKAA